MSIFAAVVKLFMLASFCTNLGTIITNTEYVYQFSDPMVEVKYDAKLPNNAKLNITAIACPECKCTGCDKTGRRKTLQTLL